MQEKQKTNPAKKYKTQIKKLIVQKEEAVAKAQYMQAGKLHQKIQTLEQKNEIFFC